jgi:hypothetical protein
MGRGTFFSWSIAAMRRVNPVVCLAALGLFSAVHWLAQPAAAELLVFYDFNAVDNPDVAVDLSGKENHGDVIGPEYTEAGGGRTGQPSDYAMDFLSFFDPAYIDIPSALDGAFDTLTDNDAVTFSLWLYGSEEQPVDGTVFWFSGDNDRQLLAHVPWSDSIIYFDMAGCDSCLNIQEPDPANYMEQWNHYAFVKNGEEAAIYQNGELLIDTAGMAPLDLIYNARFGTFANDAFPYSGLMDDIAIWDEALTPERIAELAAGASPIGGGVDGDFNGDGMLTTADLDDLTSQSAAQTHPAAYDLTGDAMVTVEDVHYWAKTLANSWVGDANLDGEFNSSDLVAVLASGTYEADVAAVWSTGDFDGNGRTNSGDLVAALADGGYEAGPRAATAAVPEPVCLGIWLALAGLATLDLRRRTGPRH